MQPSDSAVYQHAYLFPAPLDSHLGRASTPSHTCLCTVPCTRAGCGKLTRAWRHAPVQAVAALRLEISQELAEARAEAGAVSAALAEVCRRAEWEREVAAREVAAAGAEAARLRSALASASARLVAGAALPRGSALLPPEVGGMGAEVAAVTPRRTLQRGRRCTTEGRPQTIQTRTRQGQCSLRGLPSHCHQRFRTIHAHLGCVSRKVEVSQVAGSSHMLL